MRNRLQLIALAVIVLLLLVACSLARQDPAEQAANDLMTTLNAEAEGMQPTIDALSATRAAMQTQGAVPTVTVTPVVQLLTGNDGLETTLIWNITDFGLGAGGGSHELYSTSEAHHFLFEGHTGSEANIHVNPASPDSLPQFVLLDPSSSAIGQAAAQGPAQGAEITLILPADGVYHIRVSAIVPGKYALGMTITD